MLLKWKPTKVSPKGFSCFKAYFECVNVTAGALKKSAVTAPSTVMASSSANSSSHSSIIVENLDLKGLDYLWQVITDCEREEIVDDVIEYLLAMCFANVHSRYTQTLARDPRFDKCRQTSFTGTFWCKWRFFEVKCSFVSLSVV